jgi:hypothetical protein
MKITVVSAEKSGTRMAKDGKWKITSFKCDGLIDGAEAEGFTLKTFDDEIAAKIADGFECEAKKDEFNGMVSYVVEDGRDGGGHAGADFKKKPYGGGGGFKKKEWIPPMKYTVEEYDALFDHSFSRAGHTLRAAYGDKFSVESQCALTATYLIGAQKSEIIVAPAKSAVSDVDRILTERGLLDRIKATGVDPQEVDAVWEDSGHSKIKFIAEINKLLERLEKVR